MSTSAAGLPTPSPTAVAPVLPPSQHSPDSNVRILLPLVAVALASMLIVGGICSLLYYNRSIRHIIQRYRLNSRLAFLQRQRIRDGNAADAAMVDEKDVRETFKPVKWSTIVNGKKEKDGKGVVTVEEGEDDTYEGLETWTTGGPGTSSRNFGREDATSAVSYGDRPSTDVPFTSAATLDSVAPSEWSYRGTPMSSMPMPMSQLPPRGSLTAESAIFPPSRPGTPRSARGSSDYSASVAASGQQGSNELKSSTSPRKSSARRSKTTTNGLLTTSRTFLSFRSAISSPSPPTRSETCLICLSTELKPSTLVFQMPGCGHAQFCHDCGVQWALACFNGTKAVRRAQVQQREQQVASAEQPAGQEDAADVEVPEPPRMKPAETKRTLVCPLCRGETCLPFTVLIADTEPEGEGEGEAAREPRERDLEMGEQETVQRTVFAEDYAQ